MKNFNSQNGISLIELLIGLAISFVVLSGVTQTYVAIISSAGNTLTETQLVQQLSSVTSVISRDVRRSGYWGNRSIADLYNPSGNPFNQVNNTALEVLLANVQIAGNNAAGGECLLYTYDADEDGLLDDGDIFGFRLAGGAVQMRTSGDTGANARHDLCNDADDTWMMLTDPNTITINTLNFSLGNSECLNIREPDGLDNDAANGVDDAAEADCYAQAPVAASGDITIETRQVTITLAGNSATNAATIASMTQDVRVRNELVRVW
jgi:prepilin peptidase dependent protein B